jgi:catechol 2,3-dioxygenase-like lactoylglutathione lyase family enzyme
MTFLNHLAIMCDDPVRMRDWYQRWFGFEEYHATSAGALYITDGHFSVGLLKRGAAVGEANQERGLHHIGFEIESILEIERNLEDFDPSIRIERRPADDPFAEYRIIDPEGIIVDLSEKGYGVVGEPRIPGIRHLASCNHDIPRKFAFYHGVLGVPDAKRTEDEVEEDILTATGQVPANFRYSTPSQFVGDGYINFALLPPRSDEPEWRWGFDHFGVLVTDPLRMVQQMGQADTTGRPNDVRPVERMVEYGVRDPEGNRLDLSSHKGWKVADGKYARITG